MAGADGGEDVVQDRQGQVRVRGQAFFSERVQLVCQRGDLGGLRQGGDGQGERVEAAGLVVAGAVF